MFIAVGNKVQNRHTGEIRVIIREDKVFASPTEVVWVYTLAKEDGSQERRWNSDLLSQHWVETEEN